MKRIAGAALVAALVGLAGCGAPTAATTPSQTPAETIRVAGDVRVELDYIAMGQQKLTTAGDRCIVKDGYSDVDGGAAVILMDGSGATVGKTQLSSPILAADEDAEKLWDGWCELTFSAEIPAGLDYYRVKVGDRDPLDFTEDEMVAGVGIDLGDV